jgi:hypothetical protein
MRTMDDVAFECSPAMEAETHEPLVGLRVYVDGELESETHISAVAAKALALRMIMAADASAYSATLREILSEEGLSIREVKQILDRFDERRKDETEVEF